MFLTIKLISITEAKSHFIEAAPVPGDWEIQ